MGDPHRVNSQKPLTAPRRHGQASRTLCCGDGNDCVDGGDGDDSISGGGGDDLVIGGPGKDTLGGATGKDVLSAYDLTKDAKVNGGNQVDQLYVDKGEATPGGGDAFFVGIPGPSSCP